MSKRTCSFDADAAATDRVPATTSVQPPETNLPDSSRETEWGTTLTSDDHPVTFRHSGWAHERQRIRQALIDCGIRPRALISFDLCGSDPWLAVDEDDPEHLTVITNHCHSHGVFRVLEIEPPASSATCWTKSKAAPAASSR